MTHKRSFAIVSLLLVLLALSSVYVTSRSSNELTGAAVILESFTDTEVVITFAVLFLGVIILLCGRFCSTTARLRRKLKKLEIHLREEAADIFKRDYVEAYQLYLKLSDKHKLNFYGRLSKIREKVEIQLQAEHKVGDLLSRETQGGLVEQRQLYLEVYDAYQRLSAQMQEKYYPRLVQLRERLERGN